MAGIRGSLRRRGIEPGESCQEPDQQAHAQTKKRAEPAGFADVIQVGGRLLGGLPGFDLRHRKHGSELWKTRSR